MSWHRLFACQSGTNRALSLEALFRTSYCAVCCTNVAFVAHVCRAAAMRDLIAVDGFMCSLMARNGICNVRMLSYVMAEKLCMLLRGSVVFLKKRCH